MALSGRFSRPVHYSHKDKPRLEIQNPEPGEVPAVVPSALHDAYHTSLPAELAKIDALPNNQMSLPDWARRSATASSIFSVITVALG